MKSLSGIYRNHCPRFNEITVQHLGLKSLYQAQYLRVPRLLTDLRDRPWRGHHTEALPRSSPASRCSSSTTGAWRRSTARGARDLLEILDDRLRPALGGRHQPTSRSPTGTGSINDPTLADAILDRLVHGATRIELHGTSMRTDDANAGYSKS